MTPHSLQPTRLWRAAAMLLALTLALATVAFAQGGFPRGLQGAVTVEPTHGIVGSEATLTGENFEPGATLDLVWTTFDGQWDLEMEDGEYTGNFLGRSFTPSEEALASTTVADDGTFVVDFAVPEGFGGTHDIYVREDGDNLNKAGFAVDMHAEMSPEEGPIGTDITVSVTGLDQVHDVAGWYALMYDNQITGFVTAMQSNGSASFEVPAAGRVGKHLVQLRNAPFNAPYLALESSPYAYLPEPSFTFTVTDEDPILPAPIEEQNSAPVAGTEPEGDGPAIWVDPVDAPVFTPSTVYGKGFAPDTEVDLAYTNMSGSRVTTSGFSGTMVDVATVSTGADGTFELPFEIPDALGGEHRLEATVGDEREAFTYFGIAPSAFPIEPASGPFGTAIELHLKGIGWTQTNNIFAVVVDNVFFGYACGFSTNGDVVVPMIASWEPGVHYIDLYPSFYRNKDYSAVDESPFLFRQAILTHQDHPENLHYRYTFEVTEEE